MEPKYEICEDKLNPGDWRVEYDNDSNEIAIFVGTYAERRAREYLAWKSYHPTAPPSPLLPPAPQPKPPPNNGGKP